MQLPKASIFISSHLQMPESELGATLTLNGFSYKLPGLQKNIKSLRKYTGGLSSSKKKKSIAHACADNSLSLEMASAASRK